MTLIEIFVVLIPSTLGAFVGSRVAVWIGGEGSNPALPWLGGIIGAPLGLVALFLLGRFLEWWRPFKPQCERGKCENDDYTLIQYMKNPSEAEQRLLARVEREELGLLARCRCGDLYIHSPSRRRLSKIALDGTIVPYKHCRFFGRWRPDTRPRSAPPRP